MKFNYAANNNQSKSTKKEAVKVQLEKVNGRINWFIDYYSGIFCLDFEYLFSSIYLENIEAYENDTAPEVENATNRAERKRGRASELSSQKQGWKQKKTYQDFNNEILTFCY